MSFAQSFAWKNNHPNESMLKLTPDIPFPGKSKKYETGQNSPEL
jgi:hypothetical protein